MLGIPVSPQSYYTYPTAPGVEVIYMHYRSHSCEDYIGGHIPHALHRPSSTFQQHLPTLFHELQGVDKVIFHCALSQQRGPSAALAYLKHKEHKQNLKNIQGGDEDDELAEALGKNKAGAGEQEVLVLEGGFVKWQEVYGKDERLTVGYDSVVWGGWDAY